MENGAIADGQITASSQWDANHRPSQARLNLIISFPKSGSWTAYISDVNQWLQVDLGDQYTNVTRIATQGRQDNDQWVTKYNLHYSDDGITFDYYRDNQGQIKVMVS